MRIHWRFAGTSPSYQLPAHYLRADSQDVIKLVMGLIATLVALVLGPLISSANRSFDEQATLLRAPVVSE